MTHGLRARLAKLIVLIAVMNLIFGTAFYYAENSVQESLTYLDSIWWSMVTMTTVGYGDFYAQTFVGRFIISIANMLIGIGTLGYLLGEVANLVIENQSKRKRGMNEISSTDHIIFCNYPGTEKVISLVEELKANASHADADFVIVTDAFEQIPDKLAENKIKFIKGSPTHKATLIKANVAQCAGIIVLAADSDGDESDNRSFVIASIIKQIEDETKSDIKVIVEAISDKNLSMMSNTGADGIITKEGISDRLLVQEFLNPGVHDVFQQIISNLTGSQLYLKETKLTGLKVSDIQIGVLKHPANLQVIGLIRNDQKILNPPKTVVIEKGAKLVILADREEDFAQIEQDLLV